MTSLDKHRRALVAILLAALVGAGLMVVTPAGAEVRHAVATNWKKVWKQELQPLADKRYYTKKKSDKRYYTKEKSDKRYAQKSDLANYYTKAESDARYAAHRVLQLGQWSLGAAPVGGQPRGAITFAEQVATPPTVVIMAVNAAPTLNCPGSAAAPDARAGFLCVYVSEVLNQTGHVSLNSRVYGVQLAADAAANANNFAWGTWALR